PSGDAPDDVVEGIGVVAELLREALGVDAELPEEQDPLADRLGGGSAGAGLPRGDVDVGRLPAGVASALVDVVGVIYAVRPRRAAVAVDRLGASAYEVEVHRSAFTRASGPISKAAAKPITAPPAEKPRRKTAKRVMAGVPSWGWWRGYLGAPGDRHRRAEAVRSRRRGRPRRGGRCGGRTRAGG